MRCPLCGHPKTHKYGKTSKGSQRYRCPHCHKIFSETFDTLNYRLQISPDRNTAAQLAGLTKHSWECRDLGTYPTLC